MVCQRKRKVDGNKQLWMKCVRFLVEGWEVWLRTIGNTVLLIRSIVTVTFLCLQLKRSKNSGKSMKTTLPWRPILWKILTKYVIFAFFCQFLRFAFKLKKHSSKLILVGYLIITFSVSKIIDKFYFKSVSELEVPYLIL